MEEVDREDVDENITHEGESILFADDNTHSVHDANPDVLERKLQVQANRSTEWIRDNEMVCSGDKTKLVVVGTRSLRQRKLTNQNKSIQVNVCGKVVEESDHEKLLGVIITNDMSWKGHLYDNGKTGKEKLTGLTTKLGQRVGILTKLRKIMTPTQFNTACEGIFYSKLNYCLQVFGHVWGINRQEDTQRRFPAFTKEDNRRLQVL